MNFQSPGRAESGATQRVVGVTAVNSTFHGYITITACNLYKSTVNAHDYTENTKQLNALFPYYSSK